MLSGTACLALEQCSCRNIEHGSCRNRDTPGAPVQGVLAPLDTAALGAVHKGGRKHKCLGMCALPVPGLGSLLTSPYPQGDAAPVGAPGEKGPNGLPVSMEQDCHPWGCQQLGVPADTFPGDRGGAFCHSVGCFTRCSS